MPFVAKRHLPPLLALAVAVVLIAIVVLRQPETPVAPELAEPPPTAETTPPAPPAPDPIPPVEPPPPAEPAPPPPPPGPHPALSVLATIPDWSELEAYQRTITRKDFERLLTTIFTTGDAWRGYIMTHDEMAVLWTGLPDDDPVFLLRFAREDTTLPTPRSWRPTRQLPPAPRELPLDGLHIAIDAGHIGGEWAQMEERWMVVGGGKPVAEGDMTLLVAKLLKPELEALGATVSMVRDSPEPVTPLRPDTLMPAAETAAEDATADSPAALQRFAQRLFYRTAEIRARADVVNDDLKPDLVLCLHFNAEAWGNPRRPTLVNRTHLHLLLNGGYNDEEVSLADQRFAMLKKLLQRTHEEEAFVGATVAEAFAEISGLPPFTYSPDNPNVRPVNNHPYLWARNLLANRLYDCPVIFMEPYVMNSKTDYARMQAGDYDGLRMVAGELRQSIFREYVDGMVEGLVRHYSLYREIAN